MPTSTELSWFRSQHRYRFRSKSRTLKESTEAHRLAPALLAMVITSLILGQGRESKDKGLKLVQSACGVTNHQWS